MAPESAQSGPSAYFGPSIHFGAAADWRRRPLLIQCWAGEAAGLASVTDRPGGGLVITAGNGDPCQAYAAARRLRADDYQGLLLLDAARYAAKGADPAAFDAGWLDRQRELGLPVLTDSGYVARGDDEALARILDHAAQLGDVIALLPLHPSWLVSHPDRQALLRRIRYFGVPVAILLEHTDDPFGVPGAVEGLLELLSDDVPVLLLRCDVSALGALAWGAVAAAAGTSAALRHLHPGRWVHSEPSVFVRSCLSYRRLDQVAEAVRRNPDAVLWRCTCPTCNDSDLDWILGQPEGSRLAREHSAHVLLDLRDYLIGPDPGDDRLSWREQCLAASYQREVAGWGPAPALEHWLRAVR